jgi:hypothetical protein
MREHRLASGLVSVFGWGTLNFQWIQLNPGKGVYGEGAHVYMHVVFSDLHTNFLNAIIGIHLHTSTHQIEVL